MLVLAAAIANRFAGARCRSSRPTINSPDIARHQSKGDAMWMKEEDEEFDDDDDLTTTMTTRTMTTTTMRTTTRSGTPTSDAVMT